MMADESPFKAGFIKMFEAFQSSVASDDESGEIADKIARWNRNKIVTQFVDVGTPMLTGFQVLNHGDLWVNNMMFKSDEDENPLDVSLIDFQGPFWGTPVIDLMYFIISSAADDIKIEHFDSFIAFYHEELTAALKKLNFNQPIPTLSELHIDMLDKGFCG